MARPTGPRPRPEPATRPAPRAATREVTPAPPTAAPLRPRRAWVRLSALQWALLVSVAAHAVVLSVRFVSPEGFNRVFEDTPLEVILVNARSDEAPTKAQAIAQAQLAGGGEAAQGRATSPLPPSPAFELGDAPEAARRRAENLQSEQQQILSALRRELAMLPPPDPQREPGTPRERELQERHRQLLRQLGEIEKRINEDNARPKRRYVSPATREEVYAIYYDQLRRRIEERGTRDFPEAGGKKLYGELTMNVTIDANGHVVDAEIVSRSPLPLLDQRAVAIVYAAAPFGTFSDAMRQQADQIIVTSRFRFTRDDGLRTTVAVPGGR